MSKLKQTIPPSDQKDVKTTEDRVVTESSDLLLALKLRYQNQLAKKYNLKIKEGCIINENGQECEVKTKITIAKIRTAGLLSHQKTWRKYFDLWRVEQEKKIAEEKAREIDDQLKFEQLNYQQTITRASKDAPFKLKKNHLVDQSGQEVEVDVSNMKSASKTVTSSLLKKDSDRLYSLWNSNLQKWSDKKFEEELICEQIRFQNELSKKISKKALYQLSDNVILNKKGEEVKVGANIDSSKPISRHTKQYLDSPEGSKLYKIWKKSVQVWYKRNEKQEKKDFIDIKKISSHKSKTINRLSTKLKRLKESLAINDNDILNKEIKARVCMLDDLRRSPPQEFNSKYKKYKHLKESDPNWFNLIIEQDKILKQTQHSPSSHDGDWLDSHLQGLRSIEEEIELLKEQEREESGEVPMSKWRVATEDDVKRVGIDKSCTHDSKKHYLDTGLDDSDDDIDFNSKLDEDKTDEEEINRVAKRLTRVSFCFTSELDDNLDSYSENSLTSSNLDNSFSRPARSRTGLNFDLSSFDSDDKLSSSTLSSLDSSLVRPTDSRTGLNFDLSSFDSDDKLSSSTLSSLDSSLVRPTDSRTGLSSDLSSFDSDDKLSSSTLSSLDSSLVRPADSRTDLSSNLRHFDSDDSLNSPALFNLDDSLTVGSNFDSKNTNFVQPPSSEIVPVEGGYLDDSLSKSYGKTG